ncbi:MAG: SDR family oxidoreductase [Deltaproteobacteria bacterium]|nr:SDR family oxidoreductase [Deltaproteobacteria bacterium]
MRWYTGKKVLITGGSSGIGKAAALHLARWGADVAIAARDEVKLEATLSEMRAQDALYGRRGTFISVKLDVGDKDMVQSEVPTVPERLGGLDVLINNAGIARPGYIQDIPEDVFEDMMRVNYFGTVYVTRALLPHFTAQGSGHISNVSSIAGLVGIFGYTAYAASKFAICGFTDCLRQELLPHKVGTSLVFPPDTRTPQLEYENNFKPAETKAIAGNVKLLEPEAVAQSMLEGIAAGRYHILPGMSTKFTHFMYRHFPWLVRWVIDNDLKKYSRRHA